MNHRSLPRTFAWLVAFTTGSACGDDLVEGESATDSESSSSDGGDEPSLTDDGDDQGTVDGSASDGDGSSSGGQDSTDDSMTDAGTESTDGTESGDGTESTESGDGTESTDSTDGTDSTGDTDAESTGSDTDDPVEGFGDCANADPATACLDTEACIVDDPDLPTARVCAAQTCSSADDCPSAPPGGNTAPACLDVVGDDTTECVLPCGPGLTCPTDMDCIDGSFCAWEDDDANSSFDGTFCSNIGAGFATCEQSGEASFPFSGELTCDPQGDEFFIAWDIFLVQVDDDQCVTVSVENVDADGNPVGSPADLIVIAQRSSNDATAVFDEQGPCPDNNDACEIGGFVADGSGTYEIGVGQLSGAQCPESTPYVVNVWVNGTAVDLSTRIEASNFASTCEE